METQTDASMETQTDGRMETARDVPMETARGAHMETETETTETEAEETCMGETGGETETEIGICTVETGTETGKGEADAAGMREIQVLERMKAAGGRMTDLEAEALGEADETETTAIIRSYQTLNPNFACLSIVHSLLCFRRLGLELRCWGLGFVTGTGSRQQVHCCSVHQHSICTEGRVGLWWHCSGS